MPFDNRGGLGLSPLTPKSKPFEIDRDYERRLQLGLNETDHVSIQDSQTGEKSWVINPLFEGEVNWNRTGLGEGVKKDYVAYMYRGPPILFKNKSYDQITKELKKKGLNWRIISPFLDVNSRAAQKVQKESLFVSLVADILSSCFKIESESYKHKVKEVGSGFYIDRNYMLTCAHVITKYKEDPDDIGIFVIDGVDKFPARVVDIDYELDCAILYCDATKHNNLIPKKAESVDVGIEIICVGSPYGYDNNVTKGILSSKDRQVKDEKIPYFFVDLAVYPGSSGGPVVDVADGKVFGMAAVIIESVGNYGLNAGIPIEVCLERFSNILKEKKSESL